jgi:hypothetical protein
MPGRAIILSGLREQIERLERGARKRAIMPFGVHVVDRHLPENGLALGAVHEFMEAGAEVSTAHARLSSSRAFSPASKGLFSGA